MPLAGCVKLEVKPDHVVADTVDAGKSLYRTLRAKSNGEEERLYTHILPSENVQEDKAQLAVCFEQLDALAKTSARKVIKSYDQQTEVFTENEQRKFRCSQRVRVKAK